MNQPRRVERTVTNGSVKIYNRIYRAYDHGNPSIPYDGRLDGKRLWFGLYWYANGLQEFVYLGGLALPSEQESMQPNYVTVDGHTYVAWMFWYTDEEWARRQRSYEA